MARRLTRKQSVFVREIIRGNNATQAVLTAYNTKNVNSAKVIGSKLLTLANIREVINTTLSTEGLTVDVLAKNIGELANSKPQRISGETVLKANMELLKLQGAYPDKKSYHYSMSIHERWQRMSYDEAKKELEKLNKDIVELTEEEES